MLFETSADGALEKGTAAARRRSPLVTSIPPLAGGREPSLLLDAIRSFETNGFDVISVNRPAEIAALRPVFTNTSFVPADEGDAIFPGRYGPTIRSVFSACAGHDSCAIVNADILMLRSDIRERMEQHPQTFLAAHRLDIDRVGGEIVGIYRRGIDAVFFNLDRFVALLEDTDLGRFQLGAPFWDIILPVMASFHGTVSFIDPPFILHTVHSARWSHTDYDKLREAAIRTVIKHAELHSNVSERARVFVELSEKFVGTNRETLSRRSIKNAMMIFDLWVAKIERNSCDRIQVEIDGALSHQSERKLSRELSETPIDESTGMRGPWRLAKAAMREWKRRRREKAITVTLAGVDF
jgi:hypothetical protein